MTPAPTAAGLSGEWLFSSEKNYVYFLHDSWPDSFDGSPRFVTAKGGLLSILARSLARNLDIEMFRNSLKDKQFHLQITPNFGCFIPLFSICSNTQLMRV